MSIFIINVGKESNNKEIIFGNLWGGCNIGEEGCQYLSNMIEKNKTLETIYLNCNLNY